MWTAIREVLSLPANKEGTLVLSVHRNLAKIIDDVQSVIPAIDHSPTQTCDNML